MEAPDEARVPGSRYEQELEGDLAMQRKVEGPVDDPHAAAAKLSDDPVSGHIEDSEQRLRWRGHPPVTSSRTMPPRQQS